MHIHDVWRYRREVIITHSHHYHAFSLVVLQEFFQAAPTKCQFGEPGYESKFKWAFFERIVMHFQNLQLLQLWKRCGKVLELVALDKHLFEACKTSDVAGKTPQLVL